MAIKKADLWEAGWWYSYSKIDGYKYTHHLWPGRHNFIQARRILLDERKKELIK